MTRARAAGLAAFASAVLLTAFASVAALGPAAAKAGPAGSWTRAE